MREGSLMKKPSYLFKYLYDWEIFDVVIGGKSTMDAKYFISPMFNYEEVSQFLEGYGVKTSNQVNMAELFGTYQEALQFIKRYFLKEGWEDGVNIKIPNNLQLINEVNELFLMATGNSGKQNEEERLWAEVILKVMHTILHIDRDIRSNYFSVIQQQIFDRFYKNVFRDKKDCLYLGQGETENSIPLVDFVTKAEKSRDSTIIKLLHKMENVSEEIFDRVGVRFITHNKLDTLNVVKYLLDNNIVIPHNIIPGRSFNSLVDLEKFRVFYHQLMKKVFREKLGQDALRIELEKGVEDATHPGIWEMGEKRNGHTLTGYRSIQFTCRQLIHYKSPFFADFNKVKKMAQESNPDDPLVKMILALDASPLMREVRFFYPFEIQIVDQIGHLGNTEGKASHTIYKRSQQKAAMIRVLKKLIEFKGIEITNDLAS